MRKHMKEDAMIGSALMCLCIAFAGLPAQGIGQAIPGEKTDCDMSARPIGSDAPVIGIAGPDVEDGFSRQTTKPLPVAPEPVSHMGSTTGGGTLSLPPDFVPRPAPEHGEAPELYIQPQGPKDLWFREHRLPVQRSDRGGLDDGGGTLPPPGLWGEWGIDVTVSSSYNGSYYDVDYDSSYYACVWCESNRFRWAFSTNNGGTWTDSSPSYANAGHCDIAVTPSYVFIASETANNETLWVGKFNHSGGSAVAWFAIVRTGTLWAPAICRDYTASPYLYMAFGEYQADEDLWVYKFNQSLVMKRAKRVLGSVDPNDYDWPDITADPSNGYIHLACDYNSADICYSRSTDGGINWASQRWGDWDHDDWSVDIDANNNSVVLCWEDHTPGGTSPMRGAQIGYSTNSGSTWSIPFKWYSTLVQYPQALVGYSSSPRRASITAYYDSYLWAYTWKNWPDTAAWHRVSDTAVSSGTNYHASTSRHTTSDCGLAVWRSFSGTRSDRGDSLVGLSELVTLAEVQQPLTAFPSVVNRGQHVRFACGWAATEPLAIFDALGRGVLELPWQRSAAGDATVTWDCRDNQGFLLPAGTYFAVQEVDQRRQSQKLLLTQ